jgi:hypothetical protein
MFIGKHVLEIENVGISLGSSTGAGLYCKNHDLLVTRNGIVVLETEYYEVANEKYLAVEAELNRLDTILSLKPGQKLEEGIIRYVGATDDRIAMYRFGFVYDEANHQSWYMTTVMPKEHFRQLRRK